MIPFYSNVRGMKKKSFCLIKNMKWEFSVLRAITSNVQASKHLPCMMLKMKIERILWYIQLIECFFFVSIRRKSENCATLHFPFSTDNRKCTENKWKKKKSILLRVNLLFSRSMTLSHWIKLHLVCCGASYENFYIFLFTE